MGLYGSQTETEITSLGFITFDTICQAEADDLEVIRRGKKSGGLAISQTKVDFNDTGIEENSSTLFAGLPLVTIALIAIGIVIGMSLVVASLCMMRRRKNKEARVISISMVSVPAAETKKRELEP